MVGTRHSRNCKLTGCKAGTHSHHLPAYVKERFSLFQARIGEPPCQRELCLAGKKAPDNPRIWFACSLLWVCWIEKDWSETGQRELSWRRWSSSPKPSCRSKLRDYCFDRKILVWGFREATISWGRKIVVWAVSKIRPHYSRLGEGCRADFRKLNIQPKVWGNRIVLWNWVETVVAEEPFSRRLSR